MQLESEYSRFKNYRHSPGFRDPTWLRDSRWLSDQNTQWLTSQVKLREKCPITEFFVVRIFPNSAYLSVSLRIQSEFGKLRTRKNFVFGHFSRSVFWHEATLIFHNLHIPLFKYVFAIYFFIYLQPIYCS